MIQLSILICSLAQREESLLRLLDVLEKQSTDKIEIIVETDNGEIATGTKRNNLLRKARGEYVCFVDDDDMVSEDYVSKILVALKSKPDCCSIEGEIHQGKRNRKRLFFHSMKYREWYEENHIYYRSPNHLNPVRIQLALKIGFPDENVGEDIWYSKRLLSLLKTEVVIKGIIYFYLTN